MTVRTSKEVSTPDTLRALAGRLFEDGHRPAVHAGGDCFVIPVGAFDEADPHGRAAALDPAAQLGQVARRVLEVGLDRDADVGPVA